VKYSFTTRFSRDTVNLTTEEERYAAAKVNLLQTLPSNAKPDISTLSHETSEDFLYMSSGVAIRTSVDVTS
jgi:hypothetical protein